jgi:hypothetical protein
MDWKLTNTLETNGEAPLGPTPGGATSPSSIPSTFILSAANSLGNRSADKLANTNYLARLIKRSTLRKARETIQDLKPLCASWRKASAMWMVIIRNNGMKITLSSENLPASPPLLRFSPHADPNSQAPQPPAEPHDRGYGHGHRFHRFYTELCE